MLLKNFTIELNICDIPVPVGCTGAGCEELELEAGVVIVAFAAADVELRFRILLTEPAMALKAELTESVKLDCG